MGTFTINVGARANLAPTQVGLGEIELEHGDTHIFSLNDFTTNTTPSYSDPEGDPVLSIKVLSTPSIGRLLYNLSPMSPGDVVSAGNVGSIQYHQVPPDNDAYTDSFNFDLADTGSGTFSGLGTGQILFNVKKKENLPPSDVGDNELNLNYGEQVIFTKAMFTTDTIPPYQDPENDLPKELLISSLPINGTLYLDSQKVSINQRIPFAMIDAGLLRFTPDLSLTTSNNISFIFGVSDVGSGDVKI